LDSKAVWQKSRPWHTDGKTSNLAKDNALSMKDVFANKTVAVFGVPAPFTGTCTNAHVPGYKRTANEFKRHGVDEIVCYSVACPYAHYNWAKAMEIDHSKISFYCETSPEFATQHGLQKDYSAASLGVRSDRFSMVVKNGVVTSFQIVKEADKDADVLLSQVTGKDYKSSQTTAHSCKS